MPRVFDCTIFFNENDVFDLRLKELWPVVDKFIVLEANQTFRGEPKPCYFDFDRFAPYKEKIKFLTLDMNRPFILPDNPTTWDREIVQRDWLFTAAASLELDAEDTLIFSDVDEIPKREFVKPVEELTRFEMIKFSYGIDVLTEEINCCAFMCPYWYPWHNGTIQRIRRSWDGTLVKNSGWEFSSLGTPEHILKKLKSFSHDELDTPDLTVDVLKQRIANKQDIAGRDMWHQIVEIDDTWPHDIVENRDKWRKFEWQSA